MKRDLSNMNMPTPQVICAPAFSGGGVLLGFIRGFRICHCTEEFKVYPIKGLLCGLFELNSNY